MIVRPNKPQLMTITAPSDLPVSLELLKKHLRQTQDLDDELIQLNCLPAATEYTEQFLSRQLMPQTVELRLDRFPASGFYLMADPIRTVDSVKYDDTENAEQTLDAAAYETDLALMNAFIVPASGYSWPATYSKLNAVRIRMSVGWSDAESIPHAIKYAISMLAFHLYDNPSATITRRMEVTETPLGYESLLSMYRIHPV